MAGLAGFAASALRLAPRGLGRQDACATTSPRCRVKPLPSRVPQRRECRACRYGRWCGMNVTASAPSWWRPFLRIGGGGGSAGLGSCGRDPRTARPARTGGRTRENMYELKSGCRAALSARPVVPVPAGEGLSRERWAENEFGNAPLGDKRPAKRLVDSAHGAAFSRGGGHGSSDRVLPLAVRATNLGRSRRKTSWRRTRSARSGRTRNTVLCRGADLNFATRAQCDGRGTTRPAPRPPDLHTAVDDAGLPLGC